VILHPIFLPPFWFCTPCLIALLSPIFLSIAWFCTLYSFFERFCISSFAPFSLFWWRFWTKHNLQKMGCKIAQLAKDKGGKVQLSYIFYLDYIIWNMCIYKQHLIMGCSNSIIRKKQWTRLIFWNFRIIKSELVKNSFFFSPHNKGKTQFGF